MNGIKPKNEFRDFGLVIAPQDENAYVLGGFGGVGTLPRVVLQPDRDWTQYLPKYERQFGDGWDSFGCTVYGSLNMIEILMARMLWAKQEVSEEFNFSERFNYILANVTPPGADPHYVLESIRENGVIKNALLPMTNTYEEFVTPKPMTENFIEEGLKFPFEVKHEYVWKYGDQPSKESRARMIREALQYSPLGVTVTAWFLENGVYIDNRQPNSHWCVLFAESPQGWLIFDSYDQTIKILSFDHNIRMCKRMHLEPSNRLQQVSLLQKVLLLVKKLLSQMKQS